MEIRTGSFSFPTISGSGPQEKQTSFNFNQSVRTAVAGLVGTNFGFTQFDDHHLGLVNMRLETAIDDDVVTVKGIFGVRDWSNEWDDDYQGTLQFMLLAELETGFLPSNLLITGVEASQAIQFFRSHLHLDPATVRPDNSIALVAGKNTILRVYVDTQNDPSRPTIASVSGVLEVRSAGSGNWIPITPLNAPIDPKVDVAITRANQDDTLNFLIPGSFAFDQVDFRVRAFDAAHPSQPGFMSGLFQGTLRFPRVETLNVRGVGVQYTGQNLNIAAPDINDLRNTLDYIRQTFPVGQVFITGFEVIDFDGDLTDTSGGGCGDGWGDLLDQLREMQGDSDDVYYGVVPSGVPSAWGGCGGGDGRVGAGFVNAGQTAAQEIGHAFDRDHAPSPCAVPPPEGIDTNYPVYDALPLGSIGEFGITEGGTVQDPTDVDDFMGYCGPQWVSPYTYEALAQYFPRLSLLSRALEAVDSAAALQERPRFAAQHLFLNFVIYRNGRVDVRPSFHYESRPVFKAGEWTPYGIELRDCHDRVLHAERIWLTDPHKDLDSASIRFFKQIPFDERTARVVFTCDGEDRCQRKELLVVDVPDDAPEVKIVSVERDERENRVRLTWEANQPDRCLYYLVRYSRDGGRSWRTLAPQLTSTQLLVDVNRLPGGEECWFQVLASEGIRTGAAVAGPLRLPTRPPEPRILAAPAGRQVIPDKPVRLAGDAFSPDTGSIDPQLLQWESDLQGVLGSGDVIYPRLQAGRHRISLSVMREDGEQRGPSDEGEYGESQVAAVDIEVSLPAPRGHTSRHARRHTSRDHMREQKDNKEQEGEQNDGNQYGLD